jgi:hypothetical protein
MHDRRMERPFFNPTRSCDQRGLLPEESDGRFVMSRAFPENPIFLIALHNTTPLGVNGTGDPIATASRKS